MKKKYIIILIILLTIGFASVSTTLVLNGKTSVAYDKNNLQVIFTRVRLNNEESENIIISEDGKSFVYIADNLTLDNNTSTIEYDIKNRSSNYDASVVVSCTTDYTENIEYTGNTLNQVIDIQAGEGYTDSLTTNLIKENTSSNSLSLKCSLITDPTSRDTIMLGKEYNITFDSNGGSTIDVPTIVSYYEKYGELPTPTKANNEFLGWYTEEGEKIDSTSLVKIKDNHTLIAKWKETCVGDWCKWINYENVNYFDYFSLENLLKDTEMTSKLLNNFEATKYLSTSDEIITEIKNSDNYSSIYVPILLSSTAISNQEKLNSKLPCYIYNYGTFYLISNMSNYIGPKNGSQTHSISNSSSSGLYIYAAGASSASQESGAYYSNKSISGSNLLNYSKIGASYYYDENLEDEYSKLFLYSGDTYQEKWIGTLSGISSSIDFSLGNNKSYASLSNIDSTFNYGLAYYTMTNKYQISGNYYTKANIYSVWLE